MEWDVSREELVAYLNASCKVWLVNWGHAGKEGNNWFFCATASTEFM